MICLCNIHSNPCEPGPAATFFFFSPTRTLCVKRANVLVRNKEWYLSSNRSRQKIELCDRTEERRIKSLRRVSGTDFLLRRENMCRIFNFYMVHTCVLHFPRESGCFSRSSPFSPKGNCRYWSFVICFSSSLQVASEPPLFKWFKDTELM